MIVYLIILIFILGLFFIWISSVFFGAPFQPSTNKELEKMINLSGIRDIKPEKNRKLKIADLGSGNGKIVIAFAEICKNKGINAEVHGYEINPLLVWLSGRRIKSRGLQNIAKTSTKNFWKQDFKDFDIITSFQINYAMPGLEKKLQKELRHNAKVVSNAWKFPNWKPKEKVKAGISEVYLYVKE